MLFIKAGANAQTYRVKSNDGNLYFLKLFNSSMLQRSQFDDNGDILEIEYLKEIKHPNIISYKDSGEIIKDNQRFTFLILNFISGETLSEKFARETTLSSFDIRQILSGILNGLKYLHTLKDPIIHNEITLQNIMLDLSGQQPISKIIDFGHALKFSQSTKSYSRDDLNPFYLAPECFNNKFSPQSDIFSLGALLYHLQFGLPPWYKEISNFKSDKSKVVEIIFEERKKPLSFPNLNKEHFDYDETLIRIIKKSLHPNIEIRFKTVDEIILALNGDVDVENIVSVQSSETKSGSNPDQSKKTFSNKSKGKGFSLIAGMQKLKDKLYNDVIDLLNDKEGAEKYGLSIPNGMLLYGPPGCGKTFFAERFAEEAGFNYKYIRSSDLASIYVHGSQEKIGKLFKEARENAPTILCFDELDALVPKRDKVNTSSQSGEVNEFLSQLNNCGDDGIFVIGTTNNPNAIDSAVLRSGRMDIRIYIPPPDFNSRKALFELYLKDKPLDFEIDYEKLSSLTENFVISDIVLIIQEVSRSVRKTRNRITMELLEDFISKFKPSVPLSEIKRYDNIRASFENDDNSEPPKRNPLGFKPNN